MHSPLVRKVLNLRNKFFPPEIIEEVFVANLHRLPSELKVKWFRDGKYIVGNITADGNVMFMTQAKSAKEFVEMVNDALYATYDIPNHYIPLMRKFSPTPEQFSQLNNISIKSSDFNYQLRTS